METLELASYLRFHRKRAGLSQRKLGKLIGYLSKDQVSKHERAEVLPSLMSALGYEAIFRVPITELFPGIYGAVKLGIEERLTEIEGRLQQSTAKGRQAQDTARTLEWFWERNNSNSSH
jgi:transcriptional regulator with XRE-family HTH domain